MNGVAGSPTFQFLDRLAEVFLDLTVDELEFTCRIRDGDQGRDTIDDLTKMLVASRQQHLKALWVLSSTFCQPRPHQGRDVIDRRRKLVC